MQRCGNGLLWRSQHWMLYQRYDLVARAKPKKIQKLTWACGSPRENAHSFRCDRFQGHVEGPTPPPMAASGLVLGLGPAHGQNGHENVKKM